MMIISSFIFNFTNFCFIFSFFTKLLPLGILFSTAVTAVLVAKLVMLGILPKYLTFNLILAFREALLANLVILGISEKHLREILVARLVITGLLSSIFSI